MAIYLDDKQTAKLLLKGDRRTFDRFFDENFARLYRFALTRLNGDVDAATELAQVTMTRAIQKLATYRAESQLFTWLCAICRNEISDWLRRQGRYREHIVLTEDYPEVQAAVDSFTTAIEESPEASYQRTESGRLIQVALDRLPPKYGDVLEWKYVEGYSVKEIAERLDIGQEAAQSLIARAKRAFADVYETLAGAMSKRTERAMQR
ncbi:MAG: RNA polymerase sigma factor [Woeseiaceae bacterium]|nr:RNA polymerase sigma factor [Woeseiaceae bacterium]